jgi:hypothetical protein
MTAFKTLDQQLLSGLAAGIWAAISSDQHRLVGTGQTVEEALQAAKADGEENPFLVRAVSEDSTLIF